MPRGFGARQRAALEVRFTAAEALLNKELGAVGVSAKTNYWSYLNDSIGTYPNAPRGYRYRGIIVLAGGSANMPQDAVYAQINNLDGTSATQLDGSDTYVLRFKPARMDIVDLPAIGVLPPTENDTNGNPLGFWSIHVYQTDPSESAAPMIA